jgi:hypothetical protein
VRPGLRKIASQSRLSWSDNGLLHRRDAGIGRAPVFPILHLRWRQFKISLNPAPEIYRAKNLKSRKNQTDVWVRGRCKGKRAFAPSKPVRR